MTQNRHDRASKPLGASETCKVGPTAALANVALTLELIADGTHNAFSFALAYGR